MKVIAAVLATAVVLAGAAFAGNVTPMQLTALSKRVTALDTRLAAVEKSNATLNGYVTACLHTFVGVGQFGSTDAGGYVYNNADSTGTFTTTALDVAGPGDVPTYNFPFGAPACADSTP